MEITHKEAKRNFKDKLKDAVAERKYCTKVAKFLGVPEDSVCKGTATKNWRKFALKPKPEKWFKRYTTGTLKFIKNSKSNT